MHKVIGFELKKMVSRPGIYILTLLLAGLLTVTAFIYKPTEQKKTYNTLNGATVVEVATNFESYKTEYDNDVAFSYALSQKIDAKNGKEYEFEITSLQQDLQTKIETFADLAVNSTASTSNKMDSLKLIHNETKTGVLDQLYSKLFEYIGDSNSDFYSITITKANYNKILEDSIIIKDDIDATITNGKFEALAVNLINDYSKRIANSLNTLSYPDYSSAIKNFVADGNYYNVTIERQSIIIRKMDEIKATATANDGEYNDSKNLIKQYNDLYNEYRTTAEIYTNLLDFTLKNIVLENYSTSDKLTVKYFENVDFYTNKENLTKYTYYIETDTNDYSYANPLSFDFTSNEKTNAYDYTYYALSIFGVILIVFAITFASYSIAGETKEGTMRFVSIRPVSRSSLILGKFFSIAIISFVMLVFSAVASMVVSGFMFGMQSLPILSIVNASKVIILHPMVSLLAFVGAMYIKLLVYISIAMLFTSFLKSDLLALILTLLIYVVNMMLPLFFGASSWLRFNPLCNIDLYAFLGSGTMTAKTVLGQLFTSVIYSGMTIWLSIIFVVAIIVVLNLISVFAFKKREL